MKCDSHFTRLTCWIYVLCASMSTLHISLHLTFMNVLLRFLLTFIMLIFYDVILSRFSYLVTHEVAICWCIWPKYIKRKKNITWFVCFHRVSFTLKNKWWNQIRYCCSMIVKQQTPNTSISLGQIIQQNRNKISNNRMSKHIF